MKGLSKIVAVVGGVLGFILARDAHAVLPYAYGFETVPYPNATNDFFFSTPGLEDSRVPSGGGVLGLTASEGDYYIEVPRTITPPFSPASRQGGRTRFGGNHDTPTSEGFWLAIDIYIDPEAWWLPVEFDGDVHGFVLDTAPRNVNGTTDFNGEHQFQFRMTNATEQVVYVKHDDDPSYTFFAAITNAGWYTCVMNYKKTGNQTTDPVLTDLLIYDAKTGHYIGGRTNEHAGWGRVDIPSQELAGNAYGFWSTLWQTNFAGYVSEGSVTNDGVLAFDNIRASGGVFGGEELQITGIAREDPDIRITWLAVGGQTNQLQATNGDASGGFTNDFVDLPVPQIIVTGSGNVTTNQVDEGGATNVPSRYYRVRLVP